MRTTYCGMWACLQREQPLGAPADWAHAQGSQPRSLAVTPSAVGHVQQSLYRTAAGLSSWPQVTPLRSAAPS
jgi:hypothetical protein